MGNIGIPRSPQGNGSVYRAIAETLALGGKVEDICDEHLRNGLFIIEDIARAVHPADGRANRGLHFADRHGEPVDKQNDVEPFPACGLRIHPLIRYNESVVCGIIIIEKADADRTAVLIEGEAVLFKYQLFETFILRYKIMGAHGGDQRTQFINDRVSMGRILRYAGIEADERIAKMRLHHDV